MCYFADAGKFCALGLAGRAEERGLQVVDDDALGGQGGVGG